MGPLVSFFRCFLDFTGRVPSRPSPTTCRSTILAHWFLVDCTIVVSDWSVVLPFIRLSACDAGPFRVTMFVRVLKVFKLLHFVHAGKVNTVVSSLHANNGSEMLRTSS